MAVFSWDQIIGNPFKDLILFEQEKDMHLCAAACCDTQKASIEDVHRCVERCQDSTMRAQKFVQVIIRSLLVLPS